MNKILKIFKGDRVIWFIFLFLCLISLIEVFSAGSRLTYQSGNYWAPLRQHACFLIVGLIVVICIMNMPYKWFQLLGIILIPISIILLLFTLTHGHGINGAARWLSLFGIKFQPSELAKMAMIIYTASVLSKGQTPEGASPEAFKFITPLLVVLCILIFPENFSTSALLFIVIMTMMIIGRVPMKKLMMIVLPIIGLVAIVLVYAAAKPKTNTEDKSFLHRVDVWVTRIDKFTQGHDEVPATQYDFKQNEQVGHANIAVATSSVLGKGPGNSVERDFLSEAASDFIFAIIIEEMGLVGGIFVVFLYICLLIRAGRIARQCDKTFPALLVIGIGLLMVSQALVNMLVAVGLFPVTGQPLPLISKGGTSTLINCVYIGMLLSVSNYTRKLQLKKSKKSEQETMIQPAEPTAVLLNEDSKMR